MLNSVIQVWGKAKSLRAAEERLPGLWHLPPRMALGLTGWWVETDLQNIGVKVHLDYQSAWTPMSLRLATTSCPPS